MPLLPWLRRLAPLPIASLLLLAGCTTDHGGAPVAPQPSTQWVVTWGASPEDATASTTNPGGAEQSFRFLFLPTVSGTEERVHFSNRFGTTPITIGAATLAPAVSAGPAIDPTQTAPLRFSGSPSVTLQPGQDIVSDPVNITYTFGEHLAVSVYMPGHFPALTEHDAQVTTNFSTPTNAGNTLADTSGSSFSEHSTAWFLLSGVDVYGTYNGTVAIFGSSSVDGHASNYGNTNSYPTSNVPVPGQDNDRPSDWLARQLTAAGYNLGVLNAGELADPAGEDTRTGTGAVTAGVDRMGKDVLQQAGIQAVVIYFGGVDLRADCVPAGNVEDSLTDMVNQAHAANVRVILATLPPSEYCLSATPLPSPSEPYAGDLLSGDENPGSLQRRAVNNWIRVVGPTLPGVVAVADFDSVLTDPTHPDFMIANLNSGDNFHLNGAGYGVQSSAIPLKSILGY